MDSNQPKEEQKKIAEVSEVSQDEQTKVIKKVKGPKRIETRELLYTEILKQNTYTDIVDTILKYMKSVKGQPQDLVNTLEYLKERIIEQISVFQNQA